MCAAAGLLIGPLRSATATAASMDTSTLQYGWPAHYIRFEFNTTMNDDLDVLLGLKPAQVRCSPRAVSGVSGIG